MVTKEYMKKRKKLVSLFFERALPNEYLVQIGKSKFQPTLGGKKFKLFKKFLRVPAYVQRLNFKTNNANIHYQGIEIEGYASWRIDPANPRLSISTLDFFDENDPMARTNNELKTICIEAVRHVIANMTIEDALKKKDEIAENLKIQLKDIETKWGIIFDQVGIEKVMIMSNRLFNDLQSEFRNKLRMEAEKNRIKTNRQISIENNSANEKTLLEKIEVEKKIEIIKIANNTKITGREIDEINNISQKKRELEEENFRKDFEFQKEKEEKNHLIEELKKNLEIARLEIDNKLLTSNLKIEKLKSDISKLNIEINKMQKEVDQLYSIDEIKMQFIKKLPEIYRAVKIQNYSVLDAGKENGISPIGKILNELIFALKSSDLDFLTKKENK